jgi:hypothetical protein
MQVYEHTQETPSTIWTVNHNLGGKPAFDVMVDFNGGRQKAFPLKAQHVDDDLLLIEFTVAQSGYVRLVTF